MNVKWNVNKTMFFDRPVVKAMAGAAGKVLVRFGAFVRRGARSSLRPARQKRLGELTADERRAYEIRVSIAKREGGQKPRRPEVISEPGQVPKLHKLRSRSPLKTSIEFVFDPREKSVIIGPEASQETKGEATQALEHGGSSVAKIRGRKRRTSVRARPFMRPAFDKNLPKLKEWKNTIK